MGVRKKVGSEYCGAIIYLREQSSQCRPVDVHVEPGKESICGKTMVTAIAGQVVLHGWDIDALKHMHTNT